MGNIDYLTGLNKSSPSNLPDSIEDLQDTSTLFIQRWISREHRRAAEVSENAMILFDYIVNEFLRECSDRQRRGTYENSAFARAMAQVAGQGLSGVTAQQQLDMAALGPGNGQLPSGIGRPVSLTLRQLLNKIKHRNRSLMNFRIDAGRHVFLICPEQTNGDAEGISEFDVASFCNYCRTAASAL
ncbi:hypothetical protein AB7828_08295 [Tardiphaga sp. 215_C5_N2_1]|uniref:hypothetical protein n=1 Tax=Tardiphaga sp. 215_C5_N2_1 TaxID=3240774 RepID=UPI003F8B9A36